MREDQNFTRDQASDADGATVRGVPLLPAGGATVAAGDGGRVGCARTSGLAALTEISASAAAGIGQSIDRDTVSLILRDGRRIVLRRAGGSTSGGAAIDTGRPVVLALHGTPGSRLKFFAAEASARDLGLTLLSVDRWGYGGSDPHPRPSLAAFADDMIDMLDMLDIGQVSVVGVSGGGPFAAAVAAAYPRRVVSLALVAPVGPVAEAPSGAGFRSFHRFCFSVLPRIPGATAAVFHIYRAMLKAAPLAAAGLISARADAVDRDIVLRPEVRARLAETFGLGLASGVTGPVTDLELFSRAWDIDIGSITARTRLWLGSHDRNVPIGPVEAMAAAIPGAQLVRLADQGHYWIALNYAQVLRWIVGQHAPDR